MSSRKKEHSVRHSVLRWEIFQFWDDSSNHMTRALLHSCVEIELPKVWALHKQQSWPSRSLTVSQLTTYDFLLASHCNCVSVLYRVRDKLPSNLSHFSTHKELTIRPWSHANLPCVRCYSAHQCANQRLTIRISSTGPWHLESPSAVVVSVISRFGRRRTLLDRRTDRQTDIERNNATRLSWRRARQNQRVKFMNWTRGVHSTMAVEVLSTARDGSRVSRWQSL